MILNALLEQAVVHIRCKNEQGTGFFVLPEGWLLTCYHVIQRTPNKEIKVTWNGIELAVVESERFPEEDVALLQVKGPTLDHQGFPFFKLGRSRSHEGSAARFYSLGYSYEKYGFSSYPVTGQVVGLARFRGNHLIVLKDADISAGVSGAPLVVENGGSVQGVIRASLETLAKLGQIRLQLDELESETQIDLYLRENKYIGFAIPIDTVYACLPSLDRRNAEASKIEEASLIGPVAVVYESSTQVREILAQKEKDLLDLEEQLAGFVLSSDIPLALKKEKRALQKVILLLRKRLQQLEGNR